MYILMLISVIILTYVYITQVYDQKHEYIQRDLYL
jgi:hypothetical protein